MKSALRQTAPYFLALIALVLFIKLPFAYHLGMFLVYFLVSLYAYWA